MLFLLSSLPNPDSLFGCKIEFVGGLHVEEVVPVVGVRHDAINTLTEQGVLVLFNAIRLIANGAALCMGRIPLATPQIGVCLVEALLLQTKLIALESQILQVLVKAPSFFSPVSKGITSNVL